MNLLGLAIGVLIVSAGIWGFFIAARYWNDIGRAIRGWWRQ